MFSPELVTVAHHQICHYMLQGSLKRKQAYFYILSWKSNRPIEAQSAQTSCADVIFAQKKIGADI